MTADQGLRAGPEKQSDPGVIVKGRATACGGEAPRGVLPVVCFISQNSDDSCLF